MAPEDPVLVLADLAVPGSREVLAAPVSPAVLDSREVPEALVPVPSPALVRVPEDLAAPALPQDAHPVISRPNREAADSPSWQ